MGLIIWGSGFRTYSPNVHSIFGILSGPRLPTICSWMGFVSARGLGFRPRESKFPITRSPVKGDIQAYIGV